MSQVLMHPLEAILRMCAAAAPHPWFPREYAKAVGVSVRQLSLQLELLYLDGLIRKAPGTSGAETGFLLSPKGRDVLDDAEAMQRLRDGQPLTPGDRGGMIRQTLYKPVRPVVSHLLLAANLLVFGYGAYLAFSHPQPIRAYLHLLPTGDPAVGDILHRIGSLSALDLLRGEWWRLLSSCFVHIGSLHILMNMYALYSVGKAAEPMWGHWRFLVIYLLSGLGGSCLGVAWHPLERNVVVNHAGASGALCGIVAAVAVWVLLNGRYLPRSLVSGLRTGLITTFILIVFISLFPGVSGWGHLGGALAGAATALLLNIHRFGPAPWRWLALAAVTAIPWASVAVLQRQRANNPVWQQLEKNLPQIEIKKNEEAETKDFEDRFLKRGSATQVNKVTKTADEFYEKNVQILVDSHPDRRDKAAVEKALPGLVEQRENLAALAEALSGAGPYRDADVEEARLAARDYVAAQVHLFKLAEKCLREGDKWTAKDEEQADKVAKLRQEWKKLLN
jgi:membrane associated rhomboid family serine protease